MNQIYGASNGGKALRRGKWYWEPIVKAQLKSGLTQKVFCDREGIPLSSFKNWSSRISESSQCDDGGKGSFIPAILTPDLSPSREDNDSPADVVNPEHCYRPLESTASDSRVALSGASPSSPSARNLEIRFEGSQNGRDCMIVVPQDFDARTLRRLLTVFGA